LVTTPASTTQDNDYTVFSLQPLSLFPSPGLSPKWRLNGA